MGRHKKKKKIWLKSKSHNIEWSGGTDEGLIYCLRKEEGRKDFESQNIQRIVLKRQERFSAKRHMWQTKTRTGRQVQQYALVGITTCQNNVEDVRGIVMNEMLQWRHVALTRLLAPHVEVQLPRGVVNKAQDQHGAQGEQQLVCGLHFHSHSHGTIQVITWKSKAGTQISVLTQSDQWIESSKKEKVPKWVRDHMTFSYLNTIGGSEVHRVSCCLKPVSTLLRNAYYIWPTGVALNPVWFGVIFRGNVCGVLGLDFGVTRGTKGTFIDSMSALAKPNAEPLSLNTAALVESKQADLSHFDTLPVSGMKTTLLKHLIAIRRQRQWLLLNGWQQFEWGASSLSLCWRVSTLIYTASRHARYCSLAACLRPSPLALTNKGQD